jgi:hypothetical protein
MTKTPLTPSHASSVNPIGQRWTAQVFDRLGGQMGGKLEALYGDISPAMVQAEWSQALSGFTSDEVERGLLACQTRMFAPTLGEFLHLCRPSLDGDIAWTEAEEGLKARRQGEMGVWSHPAVYRAACVMSDALHQGNFKGNRNRWEHILRTEFAKGFVELVPPVPLAVTKNEKVSPMPESVRLRLAELGLSLGKGKLCAN